jgi:hypothetical protein
LRSVVVLSRFLSFVGVALSSIGLLAVFLFCSFVVVVLLLLPFFSPGFDSYVFSRLKARELLIIVHNGTVGKQSDSLGYALGFEER